MGQERFYKVWAIAMFVYSTSILPAVSTTHARPPVNEDILIKLLSFVPGGRLLAGIVTYSLPERVMVNGISLPARTGGMYFWSTQDGKLKHSVRFSKEVWPEYLDVSPDETRAAVIFYESLSDGKRPHGLGCYSLAEKRWLWKWKWDMDEIEGFPQAVKLLPNGRRILVLGYWSVWYYDVETGKKVHEWKGLLKDYDVWRYALRTSYVSPSGRYLVIWQEKPWEGLALGRMDMYVTVWDLQTGEEISRWKKPEYECEKGTFSPDEQSVIFGCKDGHIREWSIRSGTMVRELRIKTSLPRWVVSVVFSPDGRFVAVKAATEDIMVFDYSTQKKLHTFEGSGKYNAMAFSSDGEFFALPIKGRICLYATSTWERKWCVEPRPPNIPND